MRMKKVSCLLLALCLLLTFAACSTAKGAVYVQSVAELSGLGGIAPGDRFPGMVVSENVAEIQKDSDKTIGELLVREGDDVTEGQELFSYDTEQLQLALDKQRLELEQLLATIENYKQQIKELEKYRDRASAKDKLEYTVQIQTLQVDLKEAELNQADKERAVANSESIMENATVVSPVTGRIQSINESGTDNYGNPVPYITIQQSGSYRVKGTIGELQRGGIMEGTRVRLVSRTDASVFWLGTVTLVDYENATQGSGDDMYYGFTVDEMTTSSKYPFYVELDSTDGLILGQHLYIELDSGDDSATGLSISSAFICYDEDGSAYVWAENRGKLEKRSVSVGEYNPMLDTIEILEGLTEQDFIAFPDEELCVAGAATTHEYIEEEVPEGEVG